MRLMRQLNRERGLTFLIVTHDIGIGRNCDRIVRMVDGRITEDNRLEVPPCTRGSRCLSSTPFVSTSATRSSASRLPWCPPCRSSRSTKARSCSPTTTRRMVMTLWASREAADDALASGFWAAQVEQFVTLFRSPPGRDGYDVVYMEAFGRRHPGSGAVNEIFGVPADTLATVLAVLLAAGLAAVAALALRNPILLKLGLRNMPRRRALGTDRRRADARDGDHRCRSRHRRHDGSTIRSYVVRALGPTDVLVSAKGTDAESIWNPAQRRRRCAGWIFRV